MIVGIGVDVVDIARFEASLQRTAGLAERLFTPAERESPPGVPRPGDSLAARFAAKEAVAKALGAPPGLSHLDAEVRSDATGRPRLIVRGSVLAAATALDVHTWHVSLSHDGGIATAMVIAERA